MSVDDKADAFHDEFVALLEKHLRDLKPSDAAPFAARFQQKVPMVSGVTAGTTTTISGTITWPPDKDTDPPD
jgi:hypothetical protein